MEHARWIRILASTTAVLVAGAIVLSRPLVLRAGDPAWDPPPCPSGEQVAPATAWFMLDPELDAGGTLAGQQLTVGDLAGAVTHHLALPPESFASPPVNGRLVVGDDDGRRSRLRLLDVAAGCALELGSEASVVRGALLSPDGQSVFEHRVNRITRADEGVWRRPSGGGSARRVLPGLRTDPAFGPTYVTDLAWADDGRLVVAACGELACRVRVLDPRTAHTDRIDGVGAPVGVVGNRLIAYASCPGLPCPIESTDLSSGRRTGVADQAGLAEIIDGSLVHETMTGDLMRLDLATNLATAIARGDAGRPVPRGSSSTSGAEVPPGTVLLGPAGRVVGPALARRLDVATGTVSRLEEVIP